MAPAAFRRFVIAAASIRIRQIFGAETFGIETESEDHLVTESGDDIVREEVET